MGAAAPDLITPVIGFRQFRVLGSELWSTQADYHWSAGVHTAVCLAPIPHDDPVPAKGCTCGCYARYTPPPRTSSALTADLVAGAVALWGRIELHAHGMRAEHARVVVLALPFSRWGKRRRTIAAAEAVGIAAVPAGRLVAATRELGAIIPQEMRPPDVMPNKRAAPGEPAPARLNAVADGLVQRER
ncbi:MAG: hypothetical protein ACRD0A_11565 [Acidimicrobiales bacterium]